MQRKPIIAGNWKMNCTVAEAEKLAGEVVEAGKGISDREIMIAPPFTALPSVSQIVSGTNVLLGCQNICWEEKGAFTAEISPVMLKELKCDMAIIGHSERRHVFGETDELINKRIAGALRFGITPIFCIGETLDAREAGNTIQVLTRQIKTGLRQISPINPENFIIAYEPVWAIGTGKTATTEQAQEIHAFVRKLLGEMYEKTVASRIRILYGGSVNDQNVDALMRQHDVDGALVGGAALKIDSFERIIHFQ